MLRTSSEWSRSDDGRAGEGWRDGSCSGHPMRWTQFRTNKTVWQAASGRHMWCPLQSPEGTAMIACGLDFGTSNSAIGVPKGNALVLAPVESDSTLLPSAVFFEELDRYRVRFGADAISTYIEQGDGRLF